MIFLYFTPLQSLAPIKSAKPAMETNYRPKDFRQCTCNGRIHLCIFHIAKPLFFFKSLHSILFSSGTGSISLLFSANNLKLPPSAHRDSNSRAAVAVVQRKGGNGKVEVSGEEHEGPAFYSRVRNCPLLVSSISTRSLMPVFPPSRSSCRSCAATRASALLVCP